jgi:dolichol-phosphate mannosyltransferase
LLLLRSPREAIRQYSTLVSFALVGASGVAVNLLVLTIFKPLVGALIANAIAQEVSIANNFVWNDRFTFRSRSRVGRFFALPRLYRFVKYNLVSLLSFAVNEMVFYLVYSHGIFYIYSSLTAIATAFVVNYFGSSRWAWAKTALNLAKD